MSQENIKSFIDRACRDHIGPGSIVTLKTGGHEMVVEMRSEEKAWCIWHNGDGDIFKDWIPIICLKVKG